MGIIHSSTQCCACEYAYRDSASDFATVYLSLMLKRLPYSNLIQTWLCSNCGQIELKCCQYQGCILSIHLSSAFPTPDTHFELYTAFLQHSFTPLVYTLNCMSSPCEDKSRVQWNFPNMCLLRGGCRLDVANLNLIRKGGKEEGMQEGGIHLNQRSLVKCPWLKPRCHLTPFFAKPETQ